VNRTEPYYVEEKTYPQHEERSYAHAYVINEEVLYPSLFIGLDMNSYPHIQATLLLLQQLEQMIVLINTDQFYYQPGV
jgi:hypothetical protein